MAFTASTQLEVRTTGSDGAGGLFDPGVAGFPTDGAATLATSTAPVFTSASYTFVAGDVGAWLFVKAGTAWAFGFYQITAVNAGAATLDAAIGHGVQYPAGIPTTVVGCASTASPTGATWGLDYSQQAAAQISFTDLAIQAGNTTFRSAAFPVGKNFIGNCINVTSGTGFTVQRVVIISTSTITATCDKALGTANSTGGVGVLGGALASPGQASALRVGGNAVWIRSGTYSITSASTNVAGGCISDTVTSSSGRAWEGYGTVRGDLGTAPLLQASGISTATLFAQSSTGKLTRNLALDGATLTAIRGFSITGADTLILCSAIRCTNGGFVVTSTSAICLACLVTGCAVTAFGTSGTFIACVASANTTNGFTGTLICLGCIATGNTASAGFAISTGAIAQCVAYGNGSDGYLASSTGVAFLNCIAESNGSNVGFTVLASTVLANCATYGQTTAVSGTPALNVGPIAGGASFFTNAAGGVFVLNNTAGAGALLRGTAYPALSADGLTANVQDVGFAQVAALAGGVSRARVLGGM